MGKSAAEIEQDNERRRHALSARVSRLDRRLRRDVDSTVETARHDVNSALATARENVTSVAGTTAGSDTAVARHPKPLLAGALVAGGMLGFATGGGDGRHAPRDERPRGGRDAPSRAARISGRAPGIFGSLASAGQGLLAARLGELAHAVLGDVFGKAKAAITSESAPAESNGHRDPVVGAETAEDLGAGSHAVLGSAWDRLPEHRSAHPAGAPWAAEEVDVH